MEKDYDYVRRLLNPDNRPVSLTQIESDTGLPASWLSKVARGIFDDPGVKKIAKLADYFRLLEKQAVERADFAGGASRERAA